MEVDRAYCAKKKYFFKAVNYYAVHQSVFAGTSLDCHEHPVLSWISGTGPFDFIQEAVFVLCRSDGRSPLFHSLSLRMVVRILPSQYKNSFLGL